MVRKIAALLLVLFVCAEGMSQSETVAELKKKLQQESCPGAKISLLISLLKAEASGDPQGAIKYGLQAVALASKNHNQKLLADSYHHLGAAYQLSGDYKTAAHYNDKAVRIREVIRDSLGLSHSFNSIGNLYNYLSDYSKAIEFYQNSLSIASKISDKQGMSRALNNIGHVYQSQDSIKKAIQYYVRALAIKKDIGDQVGYTISIINLGELYIKEGKLQKAISYLQEGKAIALGTNHQRNLGYVYRGLAEAHRMKGDIRKATACALHSLEISRKQRSPFEIQQSVEMLHKIYQQKGDLAQAHHYLSLLVAYKDSLHNQAVHKQVEELRIKYESEKKEKQNLQLKAERDRQLSELRNQKIVIYLTGALVFTFAALAIVLFRGMRKLSRLSRSLAEKNKQISKRNKQLIKASRTLKKQAIRLQEQKKLLEKSNHIKDRLFYILADDLRGPLLALKGLLPLIRQNEVTEEEKGWLLDMVAAGQQNVLELINNLLFWAKSQMPGQGARPEPVNLGLLVRQSMLGLQSQAARKNIQLANTVGNQAIVFADAEMTKLVLRNLISNAIKFCRSGDNVEVSARTDGKFFTISVQDTGVGIAARNQSRLFSSTGFTSMGTANERGSGLGLQLCRDFVSLNGGQIWVESEPGRGSTFLFTLPTAPESPAAETLKAEALENELAVR